MKTGQLAHIDRDPSNNVEGNLAYLCQRHHDEYDARRRQTKNLQPGELKKAKSDLEKYIAENHVQAEPSKPIHTGEEPLSILPHRRNNLLRHHESWIDRIQQSLSEKDQVAISQDAAIVGQGGIGKTAIANEYAHRFKRDYPGGVYWLQMDQGLGQAARGFHEIAAYQGIGLGNWENLDEPELIRNLMALLNQKPHKLVILDNLNESVLPKSLNLSDAQLLVTTRRHDISLPLVKMDLPELSKALVILLTYADLKPDNLSKEERDAAAKICQTTGCLPLVA